MSVSSAEDHRPTPDEISQYCASAQQFVILCNTSPMPDTGLSHQRVTASISGFEAMMTSTRMMAYYPNLRNAVTEAIARCLGQAKGFPDIEQVMEVVSEKYNKFIDAVRQEECYRH